MKSIVLAALLGSINSVALSSKDAPPYFNEPTFRQTWASAAGLNKKHFAVGMNGDEDLGQKITMKGQKFEYNQDDNVCHCGNCPACKALA